MERSTMKTYLTCGATALASAALAFSLSACAATSEMSSAAVGSAGTSSAAAEVAESASTSSTGASRAAASNAESASTPGSSAAEQASLTSAFDSTPTKDDITTNETVSNSANGEHAIEASGTSESYSNVAVEKTGDSDSGDEADFYGDNATVFATDGATLDLNQMVITSDGQHANGVFSYGEGTTVNITDSIIDTKGNCSGGLMTTGGGTMNAKNLRITTSGNSSAAIRSDRGGGTVNVDGGVYTTSGTGSPVIYSTADITVSNAQLESTASQGVVVEGKNSVTLNNVDLVADNNTKNSDKSDFYQAVMIYQSMSGDATSGTSSFAMNGGSLTNANGDVFFANNTACEITLNDTTIVNNGDGMFLRAAAAGWGNEGSNGGQVTLHANKQVINGDMVVDDVSNLNLYLENGSTFTGTINADKQAGKVYVDLSGGSKWTLTSDAYITSLTCEADSIDLNGHTLYVDGKAYETGTASSGTAIEIVVSESTGGPGDGGTPPDGQGGPGDGGTPPDGKGGPNGGTPPDGKGGPGDGGTPPSGTPPEKPSGTPPDGKGGPNSSGNSATSSDSASSGKTTGGDSSSADGGDGSTDSNNGSSTSDSTSAEQSSESSSSTTS